jgi:hypothetical protein
MSRTPHRKMTGRARRAVAALVLGAFAVANLATLTITVARSRDGERSAIMLHRLAALADVDPDRLVLLDVPETFGSLIAASYARGRPTIQLSGALASPANGLCDESGRPTRAFRVPPIMEQVACAWRAAYREQTFELDPGTHRAHRFLRFVLPDDASLEHAALVAPAGDGGIVNNSWPRAPTGYYYVDRLAKARNHLVEIDSSLGHTIKPGVIEDVALWPHEPDFAAADAGMQGIGRDVLFEVLDPLPGSRLLLDFTAASLSPQTAGLPPVRVVGATSSAFDLVGRGAARMLSETIAPREIDGHAYLAVDMGMAPLRFETDRRGLFGLYNRWLSLDPRHLLGFARNISFVTDEMIRAMPPPHELRDFPRDLLAPGLLFSGLYEDGWMAEIARMRLDAGAEGGKLRIAGLLPSLLAPGLTLRVRIDDAPLLEERIGAGSFELRTRPLSAGAHWIELRVDRVARLPAPDGRVASVRLTSVAFAPPD